MILKEQPEDFFVKEIMEPPLSTGSFSYFLLRKKNRTTLEAVHLIAKRLHVPLKCIGYAGNKDKRAVTEQYISLYKISKENGERLTFPDISLTYRGSGKERISLGDHQGNYFKIIVRDIAQKVLLQPTKIKNLFDVQRFGITQKNYLIGKAIVQGKFGEACQQLNLPVIHNDAIRSLRTIDRHLLRLYVSAYQSHLWNKAASKIDNVQSIPLVGFLTEFASSKVKKVYEKMLHEESITLKDFLIPQMPELGSEGSERTLYVDVVNFSITWENDELHNGRLKATLSFQLPKGVYATHVVQTLFAHATIS